MGRRFRAGRINPLSVVPEISRILSALEQAAGQPAALATLVQVEGSSYRRPGARLLLLPDDTHTGSISGGCLEEDLLERARRVLATGTAELAVYDTTSENDLVWGVGLGCQGIVRILIELLPADRPAWVAALRRNRRERRDTGLQVAYGDGAARGTTLAAESTANETVFRETIPAPPALLICGAGDDAQPLANMAHGAGWHVIVADTRPAFATSRRFPQVDQVIVAPAADFSASLPVDDRTFAVIMSHRYADDLAFLRALLKRDLPYLGQLGPRTRTSRLLGQLADEDGAPPPQALAKLHAPVGLDLGGSTPETVALAILAEIQACLARRPAGFLRDRTGPIHG
jgi:xanthine/CO dehydrogenase XdhC/CoxF family maturation factor